VLLDDAAPPVPLADELLEEPPPEPLADDEPLPDEPLLPELLLDEVPAGAASPRPNVVSTQNGPYLVFVHLTAALVLLQSVWPFGHAVAPKQKPLSTAPPVRPPTPKHQKSVFWQSLWRLQPGAQKPKSPAPLPVGE
jgi:hypothetical protein